MDREECGCNENGPEMTCGMCGSDTSIPYWCETCQRLVAEKRCQCCGLKTRKAASPAACAVKIKARHNS